MFWALSIIAALTATVLAQDQCNLLPVAVQSLPLKAAPGNQTICEKYTPSNQTQYEWISKLINLAFTGDYTPLPDLWPANPNGTYQASGILDPNSVYRDPCYTVTPINLVPYFNGTYKSNNRNGVCRGKFSIPIQKMLSIAQETHSHQLPRRRRRHRSQNRCPSLVHLV